MKWHIHPLYSRCYKQNESCLNNFKEPVAASKVSGVRRHGSSSRPVYLQDCAVSKTLLQHQLLTAYASSSIPGPSNFQAARGCMPVGQTARATYHTCHIMASHRPPGCKPCGCCFCTLYPTSTPYSHVGPALLSYTAHLNSTGFTLWSLWHTASTSWYRGAGNNIQRRKGEPKALGCCYRQRDRGRSDLAGAQGPWPRAISWTVLIYILGTLTHVPSKRHYTSFCFSVLPFTPWEEHYCLLSLKEEGE